MHERVVRFGPDKRLIGILTEPRAGSGDRPATLLLNSGLVHRIGASRMHVHMARALVKEGMTSLRFDFSGIGDSEPRRDGLTFEQAAVQEIRDAMDLLAHTRGIGRFILAGLCSGADMAFYGAQADERVIAIGQLGPGWLLLSAPIVAFATDVIRYAHGRLSEPPRPAGLLPGSESPEPQAAAARARVPAVYRRPIAPVAVAQTSTTPTR